MLSLFVATVAGSQVCKDAVNEGFAYENCLMMQREYENMVDSGKSLEELSAELAMCGDNAPLDAPDTDLACTQSCSGGAGSGSCGSCMKIRQMNSNCSLDAPGCARQVAYGGYVKSKVLIQCYGMIEEGCARLPTKYLPVEVTLKTTTAAPITVLGGDVDEYPTCEELCSQAKGIADADCNCSKTRDTFLRSNNLFPRMRQETDIWDTSCMKKNFSKYLHCVGRRVSKCYRQKWTVTRECQNAGEPTEWGGCTKEWDQPYRCCGSSPVRRQVAQLNRAARDYQRDMEQFCDHRC